MENVPVCHLLLLQHKVGRVMRLYLDQQCLVQTHYIKTYSHIAQFESFDLTLSLLFGQELDGLIAGICPISAYDRTESIEKCLQIAIRFLFPSGAAPQCTVRESQRMKSPGSILGFIHSQPWSVNHLSVSAVQLKRSRLIQPPSGYIY